MIVFLEFLEIFCFLSALFFTLIILVKSFKKKKDDFSFLYILVSFVIMFFSNRLYNKMLIKEIQMNLKVSELHQLNNSNFSKSELLNIKTSDLKKSERNVVFQIVLLPSKNVLTLKQDNKSDTKFWVYYSKYNLSRISSVGYIEKNN